MGATLKLCVYCGQPARPDYQTCRDVECLAAWRQERELRLAPFPLAPPDPDGLSPSDRAIVKRAATAARHQADTTDWGGTEWGVKGEPRKQVRTASVPSVSPGCLVCGEPTQRTTNNNWNKTCGDEHRNELRRRSASAHAERHHLPEPPTGCPVVNWDGAVCGAAVWRNTKVCRQHSRMLN
jgi:predicted nucleic acid-binding Zn ribbon protein